MEVRLHAHARARALERGTTEAEVVATVKGGEVSPAQLGRTKFQRNFTFNAEWQGKFYSMKKLEVIAAKQGEDWLVITVIVKFF